MMKGLPFNQKRGNDVIHLFQLRWGEGKTGSGFASDQFILFLSIGSLIEMFFQRAFIAGRTAVAYIGRPGKSGADILFRRGYRKKYICRRTSRAGLCERNIPDIPFEQSTDAERPDGSR